MFYGSETKNLVFLFLFFLACGCMSVHVHVPVAAVASWIFTIDSLDFKMGALSGELRSSPGSLRLCLFLVFGLNLKPSNFSFCI